MDVIYTIFHQTQFQNAVASGLVLLLITTAAKFWSGRARVVWGVSHEFHFTVPNKGELEPGQAQGSPLSVRTRTVFVRNEGNSAAEGLEIYLGMEPLHYLFGSANILRGSN